MRTTIFNAGTEQTPRSLRPHRRSMIDEAVLRALYVDPPAPGGAAPAPAAGSPAAPASKAPAPAAAPAAGAETKGPAGETKPAGGETLKPLIGADAIPPPAKVSVEDQRKFLTEKGGKADELAKLTDADLQKQYDAAKAAEVPGAVKPGDIKVVLPDGVTVDEKMLGDFQGVIADATLTPQARAQKLIDMHVSSLQAAAKAPMDLWVKTQKDWQGEVTADPEIGGTNLPGVRATMAKAITEYGGKEAKAAFDAFLATGAGNHPAIVRLVYRMSKALVEGGPVAGGAPADGKTADFASRVEAMYPSATKRSKAA